MDPFNRSAVFRLKEDIVPPDYSNLIIPRILDSVI